MLLFYKDRILDKLVQEYPLIDPFLKKIIVYGSVSRGNYTPLSDIDLLLVTSNTAETKRIFSDFRGDIFAETAVVIPAIYVSIEDFEQPKDLFIQRIKRQGLILWTKMT